MPSVHRCNCPISIQLEGMQAEDRMNPQAVAGKSKMPMKTAGS